MNGLEGPDGPGYVPFARDRPVVASSLMFAKGDGVTGLNRDVVVGLPVGLGERRGEARSLLGSIGVAFALGRLDGS
jgi:hypothetical protein